MVKSLILSTVAASLLWVSTAEAAPVKRYNYTGTVTISGRRDDGGYVSQKQKATGTVYQKAKSFKVVFRSGSVIIDSTLKRTGDAGYKYASAPFVSTDPLLYDCASEEEHRFLRTGKRARYSLIYRSVCAMDLPPYYKRSGFTLVFNVRQK